MSNPKHTERNEIIEQALLESIGGGYVDTSRVPKPWPFDCWIDISGIVCGDDRRKEK